MQSKVVSILRLAQSRPEAKSFGPMGAKDKAAETFGTDPTQHADTDRKKNP
jgi:hypothetical protein